jgi:hypothetical protein
VKLTESERQHAIGLDRLCMVRSTPESQAATIRHIEGIKELVSIRNDVPDSSGRINGCYSWQRSPWD